MEVKGTAFLGRKAMLVQEVGAARFEELLNRVGQRHPVLLQPILATTRLPIGPFLELNDLLVKELYAGDEQSYFRFGEQSAVWALSGPYKRFVEDRSLDEFIASVATIYRNYFTEGEAWAERNGGVIAFHISGIQPKWRHVYFEYAICGYFKRGLEMVSGHKTSVRRLSGFTVGDSDVEYEFGMLKSAVPSSLRDRPLGGDSR